jgi:hypothetical protein
VVAEDTRDEWSIHRPRELKLGEFGPAIYREQSAASHGAPLKEKNWMPFVHEGQLYMAHGVMPHRVIRWGGVWVWRDGRGETWILGGAG